MKEAFELSDAETYSTRNDFDFFGSSEGKAAKASGVP